MTTVYELLRTRFGVVAMRAAGAMYLVGRIFASGARLYLAAIAVSMIIFADIAPMNVLAASTVLVLLGLAFTFIGGLRSVVWSDLVKGRALRRRRADRAGHPLDLDPASTGRDRLDARQ